MATTTYPETRAEQVEFREAPTQEQVELRQSLAGLTPEQIEELGRELDEIRSRVVADLGERDAGYIRRIIKAQRGLEITGRGLLFAGFLPPAGVGVVAARSRSTTLDNMASG